MAKLKLDENTPENRRGSATGSKSSSNSAGFFFMSQQSAAAAVLAMQKHIAGLTLNTEGEAFKARCDKISEYQSPTLGSTESE